MDLLYLSHEEFNVHPTAYASQFWIAISLAFVGLHEFPTESLMMSVIIVLVAPIPGQLVLAAWFESRDPRKTKRS